MSYPKSQSWDQIKGLPTPGLSSLHWSQLLCLCHMCPSVVQTAHVSPPPTAGREAPGPVGTPAEPAPECSQPVLLRARSDSLSCRAEASPRLSRVPGIRPEVGGSVSVA